MQGGVIKNHKQGLSVMTVSKKLSVLIATMASSGFDATKLPAEAYYVVAIYILVQGVIDALAIKSKREV